MIERNQLVNGRFLHNLDGWTTSGAEYSPGDGDDHYGVAVLADGEYITQDFAVQDVRVYTVHLSAKSTTGFTGSEIQVVINDGSGNQVLTQNIQTSANAWKENVFTCGLAPGTAYEFKVINNSAGEDVKIDDVWIWHVPITRADAAARVHQKLATLAADQNLDPSQGVGKSEGDYTYAVDAGLRAVNAVNPETGLPDVRYLDPEDVDPLLQEIELEILEQLQRSYSLLVDTKMGPRSDNLSQIGDAIGKITGGARAGRGGGGSLARVEQRKLKRS